MYSKMYFFVLLEAKSTCFVTKNCSKSYIFAFILSKKQSNWLQKNFHKSEITCSRRLPDPSLNRIFSINVLSPFFFLFFLVRYRLVYNICSHFNVIILACAYFQKNFLGLSSFHKILALVFNLILTCFCIKGWYSKVAK